MMQLMTSMVMVLSWVFTLHGWAQQGPSSEAVDWGRESLESHRRLPWYDADQDKLQRIEVEPNEDDENRHSQWAATDSSPAKSKRRDWSLLATILQTLAWIALALFLGFLIWVLVWAARRADFAGASSVHVAETVAAGQSRIEDLPLPVSRQYRDLLSAAGAFFEAGDLGKAIIYMFAHQLVELDKYHLIQLSKGKTNRQYLKELQRYPRFVELVRHDAGL